MQTGTRIQNRSRKEKGYTCMNKCQYCTKYLINGQCLTESCKGEQKDQDVISVAGQQVPLTFELKQMILIRLIPHQLKALSTGKPLSEFVNLNR